MAIKKPRSLEELGECERGDVISVNNQKMAFHSNPETGPEFVLLSNQHNVKSIVVYRPSNPIFRKVFGGLISPDSSTYTYSLSLKSEDIKDYMKTYLMSELAEVRA